MRSTLCCALVLLVVAAAPVWGQQPLPASEVPGRYRADADRLIDAALADSAAWHRLAALVDGFGHRLSGSRSLEAAIDWIEAIPFSETRNYVQRVLENVQVYRTKLDGPGPGTTLDRDLVR